ncbi:MULTISPECIES: HlyD family secretion protein [unclassified Microbacterium]|uniref:HlyD family efflux transporter periplasmic adaptor subunit n=1 Tax=unclassified Microbacterium TaxID=2609290 RepID=UPI000C2C2B7C|nr:MULTISPECIES: HlyD family secretion protein [unclassified Microbacterium]
MTWGNRVRLAVGLVLTLAIVAACTLVFNQRQHQVQSASAMLVSQRYPVGTDFGGIVVEQLVDEGDEVVAGQPLFAVRSLQLQRETATASLDESDGIATVDADGTATVVSTVDGTVSSIDVPQGGFAQAGGVLATVDRAGSLFVEAEFVLTARDYGRIEVGSSVSLRLPNQSTLPGTVTAIQVTTVDGQALSTLRIESDELAGALTTGPFQPGTPVVATLELRDDGPFAGVADAVSDLLRKVGL